MDTPGSSSQRGHRGNRIGRHTRNGAPPPSMARSNNPCIRICQKYERAICGNDRKQQARVVRDKPVTCRDVSWPANYGDVVPMHLIGRSQRAETELPGKLSADCTYIFLRSGERAGSKPGCHIRYVVENGWPDHLNGDSWIRLKGRTQCFAHGIQRHLAARPEFERGRCLCD